MNKTNRTNGKSGIARKARHALLGLCATTASLSWAGVGLFCSCSDMMQTESELVEFEKDNTLNHPTDSVYSVLGIVNKMQAIADRLVLLGEVRGDLVTVTEAASTDLKQLAAFDFAHDNKYCQAADYYAVINNCNYYLAHADTAMQRRGRQLFMPEYAAVKSYRAWTYLQLAQAYGAVPLVTEPVMTEQQAREAMNQPRLGIADLCQYFIDDLTPFVGVELPRFGVIGEYDSQKFFIPMKALLGDLCLWAGRYAESARWYHEYLTDTKSPVVLSHGNRVVWPSIAEYTRVSNAYYVSSLEELSYIPMERRVFDGIVSDLENIFCSTQANKQYFQLTPSAGMRRLSAEQVYCTEYKTDTQTDTIYAPRSGFTNSLLLGDLRLYSNYSLLSLGGKNEYSENNNEYQFIYKIQSRCVTTYRAAMVYLRYAEALNRAGFPQSAMVILKYGMCDENLKNYADSIETDKAGDLVSFDETVFTRENTIGIHSRGSGDAQANAYYVLPLPPTQLATRQDTVDYQIPLVEDMIINEMALDGAFEGNRFNDLLRVALRRGDPAYLADPVARRNGEADESLRSRLMNQSNWFLPLK